MGSLLQIHDKHQILNQWKEKPKLFINRWLVAPIFSLSFLCQLLVTANLDRFVALFKQVVNGPFGGGQLRSNKRYAGPHETQWHYTNKENFPFKWRKLRFICLVLVRCLRPRTAFSYHVTDQLQRVHCSYTMHLVYSIESGNTKHFFTRNLEYQNNFSHLQSIQVCSCICKMPLCYCILHWHRNYVYCLHTHQNL